MFCLPFIGVLGESIEEEEERGKAGGKKERRKAGGKKRERNGKESAWAKMQSPWEGGNYLGR